jgi:hypothetical protein
MHCLNRNFRALSFFVFLLFFASAHGPAFAQTPGNTSCADKIDYTSYYRSAVTACTGDNMKAEVGAISLKGFAQRYAFYKDQHQTNMQAWLQYDQLADLRKASALCDDYNLLKKQSIDYEINYQCSGERLLEMESLSKTK